MADRAVRGGAPAREGVAENARGGSSPAVPGTLDRAAATGPLRPAKTRAGPEGGTRRGRRAGARSPGQVRRAGGEGGRVPAAPDDGSAFGLGTTGARAAGDSAGARRRPEGPRRAKAAPSRPEDGARRARRGARARRPPEAQRTPLPLGFFSATAEQKRREAAQRTGQRIRRRTKSKAAPSVAAPSVAAPSVAAPSARARADRPGAHIPQFRTAAARDRAAGQRSARSRRRAVPRGQARSGRGRGAAQRDPRPCRGGHGSARETAEAAGARTCAADAPLGPPGGGTHTRRSAALRGRWTRAPSNRPRRRPIIRPRRRRSSTAIR